MTGIRVRFWIDGEEVTLPADWRLHLASEGGRVVATSVELADGRFLPVAEAVVRAGLETTTSRAANRTALP